MKLSLSIAQKLVLLRKGERLAFSKLKYPVVEDMLNNGILGIVVQGRSKKVIFLSNPNSMALYLKNHFGIDDLEAYVLVYQKEDLSRAEAIAVSSNSKLKQGRTFEGFLVNSYQAIECKLNEGLITVNPTSGTFTFVYSYKNFFPPAGITIVGVENADNFREIARQKYLFSHITPLFVSRYPQNQNKDLLNWLRMIPNNYLHFGDFDFSGLNIYCNEYKKHLQNKAQFFIPENVEQIIASKGNRDLFAKQSLQFKEDEVDEIGIATILKYIRKYKKGLEQEIFIRPLNQVF